MGTHPRFERKDLASLITNRTRNSELWFVNNPAFESAILGELAVCCERYDAVIYAFAIEGNHFHYPIQFPEGHISSFLRDLNSWVGRNAPRFVPNYPGGSLWARPPDSSYLPAAADIEDRFFYTVLQPVNDGLVERISDYPGYNCFSDAVSGIAREFKIVDRKKYNSDKRWKKGIRIQDYTRVVKLQFARLPGYEHLSQQEYSKLMHQKLEERRLVIVAERKAKGLGFLGREGCLKVKAGSVPFSTKTSTINSHRPRVLSVCPVRFAETIEWYFTLYKKYKEISRRYLAGENDIEFPPGTNKPPLICTG